MRDIKFRYVFRRNSDGHIYIIGLDIEGVEQKTGELRVMFENDLWKLISRDQFTGPQDKNGANIYEGDILCVPDYTPRDDGNYDDEVVEVYFDDGRLIWAFRYGSYGFDYLTEAEGATIIGNIHENPELLK